MAYNGYGNSGGYGYGSANPYDNHGSSLDYPPSYRPTPSPRPAEHDVEMQPLAHDAYTQNQGYQGGYDNGYGQPPARDPNAILNDCREVSRAIDELEGRLRDLQRVQRGFITGTGATNKEIDAMGADIMTGYRGLGERVKRIKSQPDARLPRNEPQVNALDRRIRKAINHYQTVESEFRREVQDQQRRQYLIVRPEASEQEIREATESGGDTQIFQQALMQSDRRGQAQSTLRNVQQRHDAIQQIEKTMMELQSLFQDLDAIVVQQEPMIENIEKQADDTNTHMVNANEQLGIATVSARKARRKKWMCLGLAILIVIIIAIIIIIVTKVLKLW